MSTFQTRVEDLIGSVGDTTALSDWLTEEARKITDLMPEDKLLQHSDTISISASSGRDITDKKVLAAHVSSYRAELVDYADLSKYNDSNSIHYATARDPVAYIVVLSGTQIIKTAYGGSAQAGTLTYFQYPTVAYSDSSISDFPFELERLIVLGAAIKGRVRQLADKRATLPALLTNTDLPDLAYTNDLIDLSTDLTNLNTYIVTDKDPEQAAAMIGQITAKLNEYQAEASIEQKAVLETIQKELQKTSNNVATVLADIQGMQAELEILQKQYDQDLQLLIGAGKEND